MIAKHEIKVKASPINVMAAILMIESLIFFLSIDILLCNYVPGLFGFVLQYNDMFDLAKFLFIVLCYRRFRRCITNESGKAIPLRVTYPKAPSGRELSPKVTEGECVTVKFSQAPSHAGSFHR